MNTVRRSDRIIIACFLTVILTTGFASASFAAGDSFSSGSEWHSIIPAFPISIVQPSPPPTSVPAAIPSGTCPNHHAAVPVPVLSPSNVFGYVQSNILNRQVSGSTLSMPGERNGILGIHIFSDLENPYLVDMPQQVEDWGLGLVPC
jgi:hypothetical protein